MFKKKDSKYILAHGCSFTDFHFQNNIHQGAYNQLLKDGYTHQKALRQLSKDGYTLPIFPKWPEILGERLGVPVTNLAHAGNDNDTIFNETIDHILQDKPWMVVIGITEIPRFRMYGDQALTVNPYFLLQNNEHLDKMKKDQSHTKSVYPWIEWFWKTCQTPDRQSRFAKILEMMYDHHYKRIIRLQKICDQLGIKLIMTHLLEPVSHNQFFKEPAKKWGIENTFSQKDLYATQIQPKSFYQVDPKTIFGWPHMHELGEGYHILDQSSNVPFPWKWPDYVIDKNDGHPNKYGHEIIAEQYYEHYKKIYT
jgi:hypothetical protein